MKPGPFAATFVLLFVSAACTKNETVRPETVEVPSSEGAPAPKPLAEGQQVSPKPADADPAEEVPFVVEGNEAAAPPIGQACKGTSGCGTRGRVALRAYRIDGFPGPQRGLPCRPSSLTARGTFTENDSSACVSGDRLYAATNCVVCRMPQGTRVEAVLDELTPSQLASLQKHLRFTARGPLRTPAEWQAAIQDADRAP